MQTSVASCPSPEKTTGRSTEISGETGGKYKKKKERKKGGGERTLRN